MDEKNEIRLSLDNLNLIKTTHKTPLGHHYTLRFVSLSPEASFKVRYGDQKQRLYDGDLEIVRKKGYLTLINTVPLEKYTAGVVESEGGHKNAIEYLKAQAVLARTFAVKNRNKFIRYGYNLTDDVRSQVYFSKCHKVNANSILLATEETQGMILVDGSEKPIIAAFHANSGGYTAASENVWVKSVSYLKSKKDSYSLKQPSSEWVKVIDKEDYFNFFQKNYPSLYAEEDFLSYVLGLQQKVRKGYFSYDGVHIKFKELRSYFKLRSAYFNVVDKGENVLLLGKGYGHGLGLSQEGAMRMADLNFDFERILSYYFSATHLRNLAELDIEFR